MTEAMRKKISEYNNSLRKAEELLWFVTRELANLHDSLNWIESKNENMRVQGRSDARLALKNAERDLSEIREIIDNH